MTINHPLLTHTVTLAMRDVCVTAKALETFNGNPLTALIETLNFELPGDVRVHAQEQNQEGFETSYILNYDTWPHGEEAPVCFHSALIPDRLRNSIESFHKGHAVRPFRTLLFLPVELIKVRCFVEGNIPARRVSQLIETPLPSMANQMFRNLYPGAISSAIDDRKIASFSPFDGSPQFSTDPDEV